MSGHIYHTLLSFSDETTGVTLQLFDVPFYTVTLIRTSMNAFMGKWVTYPDVMQMTRVIYNHKIQHTHCCDYVLEENQ